MKTGIDVLKYEMSNTQEILTRDEEQLENLKQHIGKHEKDIIQHKSIIQELQQAISILEKSSSEQVKTKKQK